MKMLRLLVFLLLICAPVLLRAQANPKVTIDTIQQGSVICLDTSVTSFKACIVLPGGLAMERICYGYVFFYGAIMKPGTVIIIDKIASRNSAGGTLRLPSRKYIVR